MTLNDLARKIYELTKNKIGRIIEQRIKQFKELKNKNSDAWFSELCFCILTANSSAKLGIKIQERIGVQGFLTLSLEQLSQKLKELGHRFYSKRAEYIVEARKYRNIKKIVEKFPNEKEAREWLVKNVKGLGYKEASHFLRNVGFDNVAILDRHILKILHEHKLIEKIPKSLSRKRYLEIEKILEKLARKTQLTLSKLDLFLWYMKTGEILK